MPNVLDIDPVRRLAKRASARIGDQTIAKRYEKLAEGRVFDNPRNFRPASEAELNRAPDWARDAIARGEIINVFRSSSGMAARLHTVARRLADTVRLAAMDCDAKSDMSATINEARRFLAKFNRVNFEMAARKALGFSHALASFEGDLDAAEVCASQSIVLLGGRVWHRVTSVAELRKIGREFINCLARSSRLSGYGAMLARGQSQFWVLRDMRGAGLIVASATAPLATQFTEVKGPRNAPIRNDHPDLVQLGIAIGVRPPPTPPPSPPAAPGFGATPTGLINLIEQLHRRCHCDLCRPRLYEPLRLRLRVRAH